MSSSGKTANNKAIFHTTGTNTQNHRLKDLFLMDLITGDRIKANG
jgi:hypothetical protein